MRTYSRVLIITTVALMAGCASSEEFVDKNSIFISDEGKIANLTDIPITEPYGNVVSTIYFDYNKDSFRSEQIEMINRHAQCMMKDAYEASLFFAGHTDNRGSVAYNLELGKRRALSVARVFRDKGVEESRIVIESFGKSKLEVIDTNEEAHRRNRRVNYSVPMFCCKDMSIEDINLAENQIGFAGSLSVNTLLGKSSIKLVNESKTFRGQNENTLLENIQSEENSIMHKNNVTDSILSSKTIRTRDLPWKLIKIAGVDTIYLSMHVDSAGFGAKSLALNRVYSCDT